jgi:hypothetical protein
MTGALLAMAWALLAMTGADADDYPGTGEVLVTQRLPSGENLAVFGVDIDLDFDLGVVIQIGIVVVGEIGFLDFLHGQIVRGL